ncbi:hypothetical protein ACQ4PT_000489 [Festuca glaucescens]
MEIRDAEALSLDVMLRALDVVALLKVEAAPVAVLLIVVVVSALVSGTSRQGSPAALQEPEITIFAVAISEISIEALASTAMIEGTTVEAPKPTVVMYGYANEGLMFCECPTTGTFRPKIDNAKMAKVTVTGDVLTIPEIIEQLKRIVPSENFHWEVQHYHNNVFKVKFPNKSEVQRARNFRMYKVPDRATDLLFDVWSSVEEPLYLLPEEKKVARMLIGCVNHTLIPETMDVFIKKGFYKLDFLVEQMVNVQDAMMEEAQNGIDGDKDGEGDYDGEGKSGTDMEMDNMNKNDNNGVNDNNQNSAPVGGGVASSSFAQTQLENISPIKVGQVECAPVDIVGSGKSFAVNVPSANCEEDLALGLPSGVLSASGSPTLASVAAAVGHAAVQSPTAGSVVADEARTGRGEDTRLAGSLQGEGGKKSTCHVLRTTWGSPMGAQCVRASDCSGIADGRGSPGGSSAGHVSGQGSSTPKINAGIAEWADGFASFFEFARQCS